MAGPQPLLSALYTLLTDFLSGNLRKQGLQARPRGHTSLDLPWALQGWERHCTAAAPPRPPTHTHPVLAGAVHGGHRAAAEAVAPAEALGPDAAPSPLADAVGGSLHHGCTHHSPLTLSLTLTLTLTLTLIPTLTLNLTLTETLTPTLTRCLHRDGRDERCRRGG